MGSIDEVESFVHDHFIGSFHPLSGERAGILDLLCAVRLSKRMDDAARPELLMELGVFWIVIGLGFFLCIQMIEVAIELIEPVGGR